MPPKKKLNLRSLPDDGEEHEISIQNCVSTFNLNNKLDLRKEALQHFFFEYNPSKFAASTVRLREPRTTALIFASGNVVCTGAKERWQSLLAARQYTRLMQRHGIRVSFSNFKVQNIVACTSVDRPLKLQEMAEQWSEYCSYEPELFPGLIFRIVDPKLVFLIFRSGKIVCTGGKSKKIIEDMYKKMYNNIIKQYLDKKNSTTSSSVYRTEVKRKKINQSTYKR